ncbi:MAG: universal stress protein [Chitinophagaceae bacterium]|nr:universal stress protein [Chitinophagaceae bacterium]
MKKIIAAIDFSDASFNALSYAAYLANAFNSTLIVVHAYTDTNAIDDMPVDEIFKSEFDLQKANYNFLVAQMEGVVRKFTVKIKGIVKEGKTIPVLNKIAKEENASLLVLGMKGRGKSSSVFGSTTTSMIGKTTLPMIIVPENASYQPYENIVIAVDFKETKPAYKFKVLNEIIKKYDPFLEVLNVQKKNSKLTPEMIAGKIATGLQWEKYNHSFNIVENDDVGEGINNFLKTHPADLVGMVARKHGLLEGLFTRSNTKKMSKQSSVPLLIMHAPKESTI